jgi:hypothetical protein
MIVTRRICNDKQVFCISSNNSYYGNSMFYKPCNISSSMAAIYGMGWYKDRRRLNRRLAEKSVVEDGHFTIEEQQPIAEQVA